MCELFYYQSVRARVITVKEEGCPEHKERRSSTTQFWLLKSMKGNVRDLEVEIAEQENRRATSLVLETNEKIGEMMDTVKAGVATNKAELRSLEEEMAEQEKSAINLLKEKISDVGADVKVLNERLDRVEESVARTEADMATSKLKAVEIPKVIVDPNSKRRYERGRFLGKVSLS